jgi:RimJ/RimL family protein N-acetyltransferase
VHARIVPIVPIAEEHVASFRAALDGVARERRFLALLEAPPLGDVREFVLANLRAGNPQLVALDGDSVVGWCDIVRGTKPTYRHSGVLGMGVVHDWRRRGVGAALVAAALAAAKERGMTRVELTVRVDNLAAVGLYEKLGLVREGLLRRHMRVDGRYVDAHAMAWLAEGDTPEAP